MGSRREIPAVPNNVGPLHPAAETDELLQHAVAHTRAPLRLPPREPEWMRVRREALAMAGFVQREEGVIKGRISAQPKKEKLGFNFNRILSARTRSPASPTSALGEHSGRREHRGSATGGRDRLKDATLTASGSRPELARQRPTTVDGLGRRPGAHRPLSAQPLTALSQALPEPPQAQKRERASVLTRNGRGKSVVSEA